MREKFITRLRSLFPVLVLMCMVVVLSRTCGGGKRELAVGDHKWDKLLLILEQIEQNYVDTVNYKEIIEKTLPFVMENLDPHSVYLPPEDLEAADETLEGNFDGIGIQFNVPNDTVVVINVIPGGPSERAGLLSGDKIIKVDGEPIAGVKMNQDSIVKRLKGPRGSTVGVEVMRDNQSELVSFSIKRDKIPVNSLDIAFMLNDTVGYMKLAKFTRTSYAEFIEGAEKLKSKGMKSLIFDLRDNSGGYLDQALLLSNEFLEHRKLIVYMEGEHRPRQEFHSNGNGKFKDVELYVLVNENSASSSEIFAGAIQDNDRGTIVGRRSYGKGLVQEPIYFTDKSGIRLTVARFYTPTGRCIQKPYSENYRYDILERYEHGEMMEADSIRRNDSLKYVSLGGKVVYGGGGIIPDIFVPLDTVGVTDYLIEVNRKSMQVKYSAALADRYRRELRKVTKFEDLENLLSKIDVGKEFIAFASKNGMRVPRRSEWEKSQQFIVTQIKGLFGRYSPLDDLAFYPYILQIDNVIDAVLEEIAKKGKTTEQTDTQH